jgi:hypothetical protein
MAEGEQGTKVSIILANDTNLISIPSSLAVRSSEGLIIAKEIFIRRRRIIL